MYETDIRRKQWSVL